MSEGVRDQFVENDVIGNFAVGTSPMGGMATTKRRKKTRKSRKSTRHRKSRRHTKRRKSTRRAHKSKGGIKYTKKGQPYRIMPNGRARFIKK